MFMKKGADFVSISGRLVGRRTCYVIGKGDVNASCTCGVIFFQDGTKETSRRIFFFNFACHNISV
jgi:hypothetical protein